MGVYLWWVDLVEFIVIFFFLFICKLNAVCYANEKEWFVITFCKYLGFFIAGMLQWRQTSSSLSRNLARKGLCGYYEDDTIFAEDVCPYVHRRWVYSLYS